MKFNKIKNSRSAKNLLIAVFVGICLLMMVNGQNDEKNAILNEESDLVASIPHPVITILNDAELDAFPDKTGSGTMIDPYVISSLEIDAGGSGSAIILQNTAKYLEIVDCTLNNSGAGALDAGIYMFNCTNVKIINCSMIGNRYGIIWDGVTQSEISGCFIDSNFVYGVRMEGFSMDNQLLSNTISSNQGDGVYVMESFNILVYQNNITYNMGNGVRFASSANVSYIIDNMIINNQIGIFLDGLNAGNNISYNYVFNNSNDGIRIISASSNYIHQNNVMINQGYGIFVNGPGNIIWNNSFDQNVVQEAFCGVAPNQWDDGATGNYWGDYTVKYPNATQAGPFWTTPYEVNSSLGLNDTFPLVYPPGTPAGPEPHPVISIWGDTQLDTFPNKTGNGTLIDPYVIDGKNIDAMGGPFCIDLGDLTKYLVISNCFLNGTAAGGTNAAIKMMNCTNVELIGNQINNNENYGIYLSVSPGNKILFNNITFNNNTAIYLDGSWTNLIDNNDIINCFAGGIQLLGSNQNNITMNFIASNGWTGIQLDNSNDSLVIGNDVGFNGGYGIETINMAWNNLINWNTLSNNTAGQAYDSFGNVWHNGSIGNYYSDYTIVRPNASNDGVVWNESYTIPTLGIDDYPLVFPFATYGNDSMPWFVNDSFYYNYTEGAVGNNIYFTVADIEDTSGWYDYYLNLSYVGNGTWNNGTPEWINVDGLPAGMYIYNITARDSFPHLIWTAITVEVYPSGNATGPSIVSYTPNLSYVVNSTLNEVDFRVQDPDDISGTYDLIYGNSTWYSDFWANDTTAFVNVDNLSVGNHTFFLYVYDAANQSDSRTINVEVHANIPPAIISYDSYIEYVDNSTGNVNNFSVVDADSISGPYTIYWGNSTWDNGSWSNGTLNPGMIDGLPVGVHTLNIQVWDGGGLTDNVSFTVNVTSIPNTPPVIITYDNYIEYVNGSTNNRNNFTVVDAESISGTYWIYWGNSTWDNGTWVNNTVALGMIDGLPVGVHSLNIEAWDGGGLLDNVSFTVNVTVADLFPTASFTSNVTTVIQGETVQFNFTGFEGDAPASFLWNFGDGSPNSSVQNPAHAYTTTGNFTVTLQMWDNDSDYSNATSFIEVVPDLLPNASFTTNTTMVYMGDWIGFNFSGSVGNAPATYEWDFGDGSPIDTNQNTIHQYMTNGTFNATLTVTDVDGDSDLQWVSITVNSTDLFPVADFSGTPTTIIAGQWVNLTYNGSVGDGLVSYEWDFGDNSSNGTTASVLHQYTLPGSYTVIITVNDTDGDVDTEIKLGYITVLTDLLPSATFTTNTTAIYMSEFVGFNFTGSVGNAPATYEWDFGDGSPLDSNQNTTHQYMTNGTFNATLTVTDTDGDSDLQWVSITVNSTDLFPVADFWADATTIIQNQVVNFTYNGSLGNTPTTFQWDFGDATANSSVQNPSHLYSTAGNFTVTVTVNDTDGDVDTEIKVLYMTVLSDIAPIANFTVNTSVIDVGQWVGFTFIGSEGNTPATYEWDFGDGSPIDNNQNPTHQYMTDGNFNAQLTITDVDSDSDVYSVNITVNLTNLPPVANFTINSSGNYTTITKVNKSTQFVDLSTDADGVIVAWLWDFNDTTTSVLQDPIHIFTSSGSYWVNLIVWDDQGANDTLIIHIIVIDNIPPVANFYFLNASEEYDAVTFQDFETEFVDISTDVDGVIVAWFWDFDDGANSTQQNPKHQFAVNRDYYVSLTVWDDNGANDTFTKRIFVLEAGSTEDIPGYVDGFLITAMMISLMGIITVVNRKIKKRD